MYEYKVIEIKLSAFGLSQEEDYKTVVAAQEKEGWELVKIDPGIMGDGIPAIFEVLFKRKQEGAGKAFG